MAENNYKQESEDFVDEVNKLAGGKLNSKEDLYRIVEIVIANNKMDLLEELSFTSKFTSGLLKIAKSRDDKIDQNYLETVKKEYLENILKVKKLLEQVLGNSGDFIKEIFKNKFLTLSHESLNNLNKLCDDLSWVKIYLNDLKRRNLS